MFSAISASHKKAKYYTGIFLENGSRVKHFGGVNPQIEATCLETAGKLRYEG
jgi:hypothetical protein